MSNTLKPNDLKVMSKASSSRKRSAKSEDYDSDGGFVEDAPKIKKNKTDNSSKAKVGTQQDDEGNDFWEVRLISY